jgi:phenylacetaldehyde dehydrogenase
MKEAGLPDGVLNIVTGRGHVTGAALVEHKDIDKVAFTGSTMTGIKIATSAAQGLKKCSLELGGKSPNIIFQDANLDQAIPMSAMGIFFNSGQTCTAPSRLYVHEDIADEFIEGIKTVAQSMKIGPGFDPDTQLGPLVSKQQLDRVQSFVSRAVDDGASIICGGKQYGTEGFFFEPTIIQTDNNDLEIVQEEVFGPVLVVQTFKDDAEAIEKANSNQYGLGAVLWTENLKKAHRIAREINAGTIGINTVNPADWDVPLGGFNQSGIGLENGAEGIEYYLRTKSVFVSL